MLELVLALPILLFLMALIANYGTISAWKVREHSVSRLAVWESRWPRSGAVRPNYWWPATATMETSDQGTVPGMDNNAVDVPVARGPLLPVTVNSNLLDETRGLHEGSAELTRRYAMLGKMGTYTIQAQTWLIDDKWQYGNLGMGDNWQQRIPVLYTLPLAARSLVSNYTQAVMGINLAPFRPQLAPLDNDPDFIYYDSLFGWGGGQGYQGAPMGFGGTSIFGMPPNQSGNGSSAGGTPNADDQPSSSGGSTNGNNSSSSASGATNNGSGASSYGDANYYGSGSDAGDDADDDGSDFGSGVAGSDDSGSDSGGGQASNGSVYGWGGPQPVSGPSGWGGAPDFQPRVQPICSIDLNAAQQTVNNLIDRIQGSQTTPSVAKVMTIAFLGLYQRAVAEFQAILDANKAYQQAVAKAIQQMKPPPPGPPFPPEMVALAQSQIPQLKAKIAILQSFLVTMQTNGE
jgi:hypothetical protein